MHRPERRGGHRHEQPRMRCHRFRDPGTADHSGVDDLPGVPGVQVRAGRAYRRPPVPARHQDHPVRHAGGVERPAGFSGGGVDLIDGAGQSDRMRAAGHPVKLGEEPRCGAIDHPGGERAEILRVQY